MSTTENPNRIAEEGELCTCGEPARVVIQTEQYGDVPYCGRDHYRPPTSAPIDTAPPSGMPPVDVYTALHRLADVRVSDATRRAIAEVREAHQSIEAAVRNALEVFALHEAEAAWIIADVESSRPMDMDEEQSLYDLMAQLSGARELHYALSRLSEMADPDHLSREKIAEARARLDAERMNPAMLAWLRDKEQGEKGLESVPGEVAGQ